MSGNTWVMADPHFGHANILKFFRRDGVTPLRPYKTVEEMDETLIRNWNETVSDHDRVYLLGDVAFHPRVFHRIIPRLKGRVVLVPGNHEPLKMHKYAGLFDDVRGYVIKKGFIMSHIPIHEGSLSRWKLNIHGHLHADTVKDMFAGHFLESDDKRYRCVSVEQTDYRPILLQQVLKEAGIDQ